MRRAKILGATMITLSLLHGGPARAQPPPRPAPTVEPTDTKAIARDHYTKGQEAEAAGNWEEAYRSYRAAFALLVHWQIEGALGTAAFQLGKHREAIEAYRHVLADADALKNAPPALLTLVRTNLSTSEKKLSATLQITAAPPGSSIWLDGTQVGTTPLKAPLLVEPGDHTLEARTADKVVSRLKVTAKAGAVEPVILVEGAGITPASSTTGLAGAGTAGPTGTGKPGGSGTPNGGTAPGGASGGPNWPAVIALGGGALVSVVVGAGLFVASDAKGAEAQKKHNELIPFDKAPCKTPQCIEVHDTLVAQASLQTGSAIAFGVGGAAAAAAIIVGVVTSRTPTKTGVRVVPVVAAGSGGFIVQGSW